MKVWLNGEIVDGRDAMIPVTDHGLLYGDGVFEGIRVYSGRVFKLATHLERLTVSAHAIGLELPYAVEEIAEIVTDTVRATGLDDAYVRLIVTRGDGALGVDPTTCGDPRLVCIVAAVELYPQNVLARGLDLVTVSMRRAPADVLDPRVKSLNYLTSALAKREARLRGADEALLLNTQGRVAEAAVANVFAWRHGVLLTPPAVDGALEGVTRRTILELAGQLGLPCSIESLGRIDLLGADEVFLTGTGARIVPVRSLDGVEIGAGRPGPVTAKLTAAFRDLVASG
jgi:branched-chain amino acid aminotransferase